MHANELTKRDIRIKSNLKLYNCMLERVDTFGRSEWERERVGGESGSPIGIRNGRGGPFFLSFFFFLKPETKWNKMKYVVDVRLVLVVKVILLY